MFYLRLNRKKPGTITALALMVFMLVSCAPKTYRSLRVAEGEPGCIQKFRPVFDRVLYQASVDVVGNHLSGILLIKQMPDSSTRWLFTNEAGFKFFDFEFSKDGEFRVYSIIDKMNKDAVKSTLKKDFQLLLMNHLPNAVKPYRFKGQTTEEMYFAYHEGEDFYYYITGPDCANLVRMERGSSTRKVLEAFVKNGADRTPDEIKIHHNNFKFDINLKRIYDNAE